MLKTEILADDGISIARAAQILARGGTVAFPTETVYGLGADARNPCALEKIFEAKKRPYSNPLIVHFSHLSAAYKLLNFNDLALRLAERFWPGPMTLLLPKRPSSPLDSLVAGNQSLVGIRIPSHPIAQRLLNECGQPLAAPSANLSNHVSPTQANHVLDDLDGRIDAIIDGGDCQWGLESTILWPKKNEIIRLRSGALTDSAVSNSLGIKPKALTGKNQPQTPGQHRQHYSPRAHLCINVRDFAENFVRIGFGDPSPNDDFNLSPRGDIEEAAVNLYALLRLADTKASQLGKSVIAIAPIPWGGLGTTINDRLTRAAEEKD